MKAALLLGACVVLAAMVSIRSSTGGVRRTSLLSDNVPGEEMRVLPERRRRVALHQGALRCSELRAKGMAVAAREGFVGYEAEQAVAQQLGGDCNLDPRDEIIRYAESDHSRHVGSTVGEISFSLAVRSA